MGRVLLKQVFRYIWMNFRGRVEPMQENQVKQLVDEAISNNAIVIQLKLDVAQNTKDISKNTKDIGLIKREVHRQGLIQEDMQKDLKTVVQAITPLLEKYQKIDKLEDQMGEQKEGLAIVRDVVGLHIADTTIHRIS